MMRRLNTSGGKIAAINTNLFGPLARHLRRATHPSPSESRRNRLKSRAQANRYANKQRIAVCLRSINRTCQVFP